MLQAFASGNLEQWQLVSAVSEDYLTYLEVADSSPSPFNPVRKAFKGLNKSLPGGLNCLL